jgi:hypothetical protein
MNEENVFRALENFLREFDGEVGGRDAARMPPEIRSRLDGLAEGRADEKERAFLVEELSKHPDWIGVLAEAVKKRRRN